MAKKIQSADYKTMTLDRLEIEKQKYQGLSLDQIKNGADSPEYGIHKDPKFESARYTLFENMFDIQSIYKKMLTRALRKNNPEFKVFGGEGPLTLNRGANFRKIKGHTNGYLINAINFTRDETLPREEKKLENPYLQLDVYMEKKEINTDKQIRTIGIKDAKKDLERLLGIELPTGIEVTI